MGLNLPPFTACAPAGLALTIALCAIAIGHNWNWIDNPLATRGSVPACWVAGSKLVVHLEPKTPKGTNKFSLRTGSQYTSLDAQGKWQQRVTYMMYIYDVHIISYYVLMYSCINVLIRVNPWDPFVSGKMAYSIWMSSFFVHSLIALVHDWGLGTWYDGLSRDRTDAAPALQCN